MKGFKGDYIGPWRFTPREAEVMDAVLKYGVNKIVAHHMGVTDNTVDTHLSRILAKMNCSGNKTLAALWWLLWRQENGTVPEGVKYG